MVLLLLPVFAAAEIEARDGSESVRDFVFTDEEGHLVLRFVGGDELEAEQREEVANVQLSTMVHDRLRADALFDGEAVDKAWAKHAETLIRQTLMRQSNASEFAPPPFAIFRVSCRTMTCRLIVEHEGGRRVSDHQGLMSRLEFRLRELFKAAPGVFEPAFMLAGQYQEPGAPYIKAYLRRRVETGQQ